MAARVGGDEFCLLLASADAESTRVVAERVVAGLAALPLPRGARLGASFGIATHADGADPQEVVAAADAAMYRAKRAEGEHIAFARGAPRTAARSSA
jgi:diguanylate cyclase (GGDEF)-like protein